MNFSIGIFHYGNKKIFKETIKKTKKWTKNIHTVQLDFNGKQYADHSLAWDYLLTNGYSNIWNMLFACSSTKYMYILGCGKEIEHIDLDNFNDQYDIFKCVSNPHPNMHWYKIGNVHNCKWNGKIHETISLDNLNIQKKPTFYWNRFEPIGYTEDVYGLYQWFVTVKWLYHIQVLKLDRDGTNPGWWTKPELQLSKRGIRIYEEEKWITMGKDVFYEQHKRVLERIKYD